MKVLLLEKTILICFLCNSLVVILTLYLNKSRRYIRGLIFRCFSFTIMDILSLYAGSLSFAIVIAVSIALSYFLCFEQKSKGLYVLAIVVAIITGIFTMLPIKQGVAKWLVIGVIAFTLCGYVSSMFINNYIHRTTAVVEMGKYKFDALIDTGIICDNPPMVIVSSTNPDIDIENVSKLKQIDMPLTTIAGSSQLGAYKVPLIKVKVKRKSAVYFNTTMVITEAELPCKAIISAMGLV